MRKRLVLLAVLPALPIHAQPDPWRQLFNGKDLTGWSHVGPGGMTVEGGLISGGFFQAVRTRQGVVQDALFGHHAALACHMANESYFHKGAVYLDSGTKSIKS